MMMNDNRIQPLLTRAHLLRMAVQIRPGERVYYRNKDNKLRKGTVRRVLPFIILLTNGATLTHFEYWKLNRRG